MYLFYLTLYHITGLIYKTLNAMDVKEIQDSYMENYKKLNESYNNLNIAGLVNDINKAISSSDIESINTYFNKISEWNENVSKLQGARIAIITQYKFLKLPSVSELSIVFDFVNKEWKFNTDPE